MLIDWRHTNAACWCWLPQGCAGPEEEVRALRHVAIVSQRKATTGDAHVNRNAAKHTLHLALDVAERYAHLAIAPRHRHQLVVSLRLAYVLRQR